MLRSKASKFAICATVCLLGIGATRSAHAQALGGGVNNDGQIVGYKYTILEDPDGFGTSANGINAEGQVVGYYHNSTTIGFPYSTTL